MIHSFLIIGQSNMAGRGYISEAEPLLTNGGKLKVLRNGCWQVMYRPVNPDRAFSGTCLAESFAKVYSDEHPDIDVGIIPCADGGTSLEQWKEGGLLFDNAVNCARLAMRTSHLVAILWHQGEADCSAELYPLYFKKISAMMMALRRELGNESLHIVVGGLGDFLPGYADDTNLVNYEYVNEALQKFAREMPHVSFASAKGLTSNPDNLHFNHASLMEFGIRYYNAYKSVEDKNRSFDDSGKCICREQSKMELL